MPFINFPDNPSIGDSIFVGSYQFTWTGDTWDRNLVDIAATVNSAVAGVVDSAPAALDTLNELASALGDDANFATTVTNAIATKATTAIYTFTIAAADTWTDQTGYFTLAKTVSGITSSDTPILDLDLASSTVANIADIQAAWGAVYRATTTTDTITLYALEAPVFPEDTPIKVKVVR
jgi:hypothetical protein